MEVESAKPSSKCEVAGLRLKEQWEAVELTQDMYLCEPAAWEIPHGNLCHSITDMDVHCGNCQAM